MKFNFKENKLLKKFNYYTNIFKLFIFPNLCNKIKFLTNNFLSNKKYLHIRINDINIRTLITNSDLINNTIGLNKETFYVSIIIEFRNCDFIIILYRDFNKCNIKNNSCYIDSDITIFIDEYIKYIKLHMIEIYNTLFNDIEIYIKNNNEEINWSEDNNEQ